MVKINTDIAETRPSREGTAATAYRKCIQIVRISNRAYLGTKLVAGRLGLSSGCTKNNMCGNPVPK